MKHGTLQRYRLFRNRISKKMTSIQMKQRQKIEQFIEEMPALSTTICKVMEVCSRTDASPDELRRIISLDPVITGQVLKLANSAYYSFVDKVTSLPRAITMLGMNTVKNMVLSTAIIGTVNAAKKNGILPVAHFWEHSIATGASARFIGSRLGDQDAQQLDELFLAGLIHDLGKIPFDMEYVKVLRLAKQEQLPLIVAERELLGIDHQQVGALIAGKWQLNSCLYNCISEHHNLDNLPALGEEAEAVAIVALGNIYANIYDFGFAGDLFPAEEDLSQLLCTLKCDNSIFTGLDRRVAEEIHLAAVFLQIQEVK